MAALMATVRARAGWVLLAAACCGVALSAVASVARSPRIEGDTAQVVIGAQRGLACLGSNAPSPCRGLSYFPPLQYLPTTIVLAAGGSPESALLGLVWLNLAAWFAIAVLLAVALRRARGGWAAALGLAAWLGSYGLAYANSSFGEVLAGALVLAFAVGCARGWPWPIVILSGFLAGLAKETSPPFLALLGAAALPLRRPPTGAPPRFPWSGALAVAGAVLGAAAANAAFNLWRYDRAGNPFLLQPILRVPTVEGWLGSLAALWASPNGGLALFAPLATALVVGAGLWGGSRALRRRAGLAEAAPAAGGFALILGMTLGLAAWYSPFGWWAWGPRLLLPWLPAAIFLALASPLPWESALARAARSVRIVAPVALAAGGAVAIHAAALVDKAGYLGHFTRNPACAEVIIQRDPAGFFDYLSCLMWNTDRFLLGHMLRDAVDPAAAATTLAAAALQVALILRVAASLQRASGFPAD